MSQDDQKRRVGEAAVAYVKNGMSVGLGTGTTVRFFAEALGARVREGLTVSVLPTSPASRDLAQANGIPLVSWTETTRLDLAVDGADEISRDLSMIKGGGGALLWERIVEDAAEYRLYIADASKLVSKLGAYPLPVEVVPFGHERTLKRLRDRAGGARIRLVGDEPFVSSSNNLIIDCAFGRINNPAGLHAEIRAMPGVVDTGLFVDMADLVISLKDGEIATVAPGQSPWWG